MINKVTRISQLFLLVIVCSLISCSSHKGTEVAKARPTAPKNIHVTIVKDGLKLSWPAIKDATKYTVFWGQEHADYRGLANVDENSIHLTGIKKGDLWAFAVTSWNTMGESNFSEEVMVVYDDNPQRAEAHLNKANQLAAKGKYSEAHAYYCTAINLNPNNPDAYKNRSVLYTKIARHDLAKQDDVVADKIYKTKPISALPVSHQNRN